MPAEIAPIIYVTRASAIVRTTAGSITLPYSEPCSWNVTLDNSTGLYNPSAALAQVREHAEVYMQISVYDDELDSWVSPDLVAEDYDYNTDVVTLSGRCRLAELDRDDQVIEVPDTGGLATAEGWTVANLCELICAHCGLTITGAPTRVVSEYNLVGNPLQMLRDLLEPTHVFRMGEGGQVVVTPATSHTSAGDLVDADDLEILRFRRTTQINNRATVERLVPQAQFETLFDESRSGGSELGAIDGPANGPHALSTPSRYFTFTIKDGYRALDGQLVGFRLIGEDGETVGTAPFTLGSYIGVEPVHAFSFYYLVDEEDATSWGPWTPNWRIQIQGIPADADPVPEVGYSETYSAGAGDRPYPEPYSSVALATAEDAQAAAQALVDVGIRAGNILNCATRLRPAKVFLANAGVTVVDASSELDVDAVIEAVTDGWDEDGDTGTITYECTIPEVE